MRFVARIRFGDNADLLYNSYLAENVSCDQETAARGEHLAQNCVVEVLVRHFV